MSWWWRCSCRGGGGAAVCLVVVMVVCDQCSASDVSIDYLGDWISSCTGHMLMVAAAVGATACGDSSHSCVNRAGHIVQLVACACAHTEEERRMFAACVRVRITLYHWRLFVLSINKLLSFYVNTNLNSFDSTENIDALVVRKEMANVTYIPCLAAIGCLRLNSQVCW